MCLDQGTPAVRTVCAAYGVVESEYDFQERDEPVQSGGLGMQEGGAVADVAVGASVADEASDLGEQRDRVLIERLQELAG
ncbi:hypothetical protein [Streptomyces alanosinicus]|uniref:Uncharacterized protein n=1 Tax=Streptomyces alanosinicus TaxID=68171 RepID=A0A918IPA5_9ACTN|nr:hypothetical protein [Streptomyces alanosinicus]GGW25148.1 hypothetical protein GCM10010339_94720 [Streptomyces alanosinicus]